MNRMQPRQINPSAWIRHSNDRIYIVIREEMTSYIRFYSTKHLGEHMKSKRLWQFFEAEMTALTNAFSSNAVIPWTGEDVSGETEVQLAEIVRFSGLIQGLGTFASRYAAHVTAILLWGLIRAAYGDLANDIAALAQAWARVVDVLSAPLYEEWEDDNHAALPSNIKGGLKYVHLVDHAPKLGKVFKECVTNSLTTINSTVPNFVYYRFPLVETNFTRVHCDSDPATYSLANNGWIWNDDPLINFALPPKRTCPCRRDTERE